MHYVVIDSRSIGFDNEHDQEKLYNALRALHVSVHKMTTHKKECVRCGHTWVPRVVEPKKCPGCQQGGTFNDI